MVTDNNLFEESDDDIEIPQQNRVNPFSSMGLGKTGGFASLGKKGLSGVHEEHDNEPRPNPFSSKGLGNMGGLASLGKKVSMGGPVKNILSTSGLAKKQGQPVSNFPNLKKPLVPSSIHTGENVNEKIVESILESNKNITNTLTTIVTNIFTKYVTKEELNSELNNLCETFKERVKTDEEHVDVNENQPDVLEILDAKLKEYGKIVIDPNGTNEEYGEDVTVVRSIIELYEL